MPVNLGWSGIFDWAPVQPERTFASDVEHLCARALATDSSLSLLVGFTPASWERSANVRRLGGIIQRYETLRLNGGLPAGVLAHLRESREPFVVTQDDGGSWQARLRRETAHIVQDNAATEWSVDNPFEGHRPQIRIEGLAALKPLSDSESKLLADGNDHTDLKPLPVTEGVTFSWATGPAAPDGTSPGLKLTARNDGAPAHSAWGGASKRFSPALNLYNRGIGLWVHGDGSGAVLNVQLKSTEAAAGGRAEHYVNLDFEGWRYVELVEPESARLGEFGWPYSKRHADWKGEVPFGEVLHDYILWVNYGAIAELNLWLNNVPDGTSAECVVGSVSAVPLKGVGLASPKLTINGTVLDLPVTLNSGDYLEVEPSGAGTLYSGLGETLQTLILPEPPLLLPGSNTLALEFADQPGTRARVTLSLLGSPVPGP
jgi:hypothetical protein